MKPSNESDYEKVLLREEYEKALRREEREVYIREKRRERISFIVASGLAMLASVGAATSFIDKIRNINYNSTQQTLEERIKQLTTSLLEASKSISQIESEIDQRKDLANRLKADADQAQEIKTLNSAQVAAVAQALRGQLQDESRSSYWGNVTTNVFFALLGAGFGELFRIMRVWLRARRQKGTGVV